MQTNSAHSDYAGARPRRRTLRGPLVALVVLTGLLAMHGLATEHNASMAVASTPSSASTASHAVDDMSDMVASTAAAAAHVVSDAVTAESSGHAMSDMGAMCVALLTGLLLLIAGRRLITRITATDAYPARAVAWRRQNTAFTRPPPDLAVMSVLRT